MIQKFSKQGMHCTGITILPNQYEWTCISYVYNVTKRKNELTKKTTKNWTLAAVQNMDNT